MLPESWYTARKVEGLMLLALVVVVVVVVGTTVFSFVSEQLADITRMLEQLGPRS